MNDFFLFSVYENSMINPCCVEKTWFFMRYFSIVLNSSSMECNSWYWYILPEHYCLRNWYPRRPSQLDTIFHLGYILKAHLRLLCTRLYQLFRRHTWNCTDQARMRVLIGCFVAGTGKCLLGQVVSQWIVELLEIFFI